ncbi:hypothetical protein LZ31DRAFT_294729 [Colletotrichum somersetense]|nr:hypothetical protein LZ31DRAFT_294729 [Colletotrichum somersetense]
MSTHAASPASIFASSFPAPITLPCLSSLSPAAALAIHGITRLYIHVHAHTATLGTLPELGQMPTSLHPPNHSTPIHHTPIVQPFTHSYTRPLIQPFGLYTHIYITRVSSYTTPRMAPCTSFPPTPPYLPCTPPPPSSYYFPTPPLQSTARTYLALGTVPWLHALPLLLRQLASCPLVLLLSCYCPPFSYLDIIAGTLLLPTSPRLPVQSFRVLTFFSQTLRANPDFPNLETNLTSL